MPGAPISTYSNLLCTIGTTSAPHRSSRTSAGQSRTWGSSVVVEIVLPLGNEPHVGPPIDLNMMVMTGGIERSEPQYGQLLTRAGFRLERVVVAKSPFSVIEASPVALRLLQLRVKSGKRQNEHSISAFHPIATVKHSACIPVRRDCSFLLTRVRQGVGDDRVASLCSRRSVAAGNHDEVLPSVGALVGGGGRLSARRQPIAPNFRTGL